jgi:hypothetical protein
MTYESIEDQVRDLRTSTLILAGDADPLFHPECNMKPVSPTTPVFLPCGHEISMEKPNETAWLLEAYSAGVQARLAAADRSQPRLPPTADSGATRPTCRVTAGGIRFASLFLVLAGNAPPGEASRLDEKRSVDRSALWIRRLRGAVVRLLIAVLVCRSCQRFHLRRKPPISYNDVFA